MGSVQMDVIELGSLAFERIILISGDRRTFVVRDTYTTVAFSLSAGVYVWNAFVSEVVTTFGLVYTVYAIAVDPKNGSLGTIAPIAIGFIVGANILAGGAFDGASMNPAVSFGPAVVSWTWDNHLVYWAGPLIGGGLSGLIYEFFFINQTHEQLPTTDH